MKIPNGTYPSPNLRYDPAAREVIFERLNPETGDVTFQVPSRETLREEAHAAEIGAADPAAPVPSASTAGAGPPAPAPGKSSNAAKGASISILV
jgi:hypothetical protein